jgi:hypothetical protein
MIKLSFCLNVNNSLKRDTYFLPDLEAVVKKINNYTSRYDFIETDDKYEKT